MKIHLDVTKCASLGICESIAPEIFEVGDDGSLVMLDPTPGEAQRDLVEEAVAGCPTGALSVED